jgi:hypothetical protein
VVYLLHLSAPFKHAKHYTGWTRDKSTLPKRLAHHRKGSGARLMQVVAEAGIDFTLARTWDDGDRAKERRLKRSGGASRYCPTCRAARARRG